LVSCGIRPNRQQILIAKAAIAFRTANEHAAAPIVEVDTPAGATAVNPAAFICHNTRRPQSGLE
jgi:microcystin degradation protein MlrC